MSKEAFSPEHNLKVGDVPKLAMLASNEPIYTDAQPVLDPDYMRRFCQAWGEVGSAILGRRNIITA